MGSVEVRGEHMASGENIYIHGERAGEDPNKVIPQRFQAGDSPTPYSVSGLETTEKLESVVLLLLLPPSLLVL